MAKTPKAYQVGKEIFIAFNKDELKSEISSMPYFKDFKGKLYDIFPLKGRLELKKDKFGDLNYIDFFDFEENKLFKVFMNTPSVESYLYDLNNEKDLK